MNKPLKSGGSIFSGIQNFRKGEMSQLKEHVENVRSDVLPKLKNQIKKKEEGAEYAKAFKLF